MRFKLRSRRGMLLTSLVAGLFLTACSTAAVSPTSTAITAATTGATAPVSVTASTNLCNLMPLSQVGSVVGGTLTVLQRGMTTANGETSVNCTYLPTTGSGVHLAGEISYLFSSNGTASYAANQKDDASRGEKETTLSGLGDDAFWAVSPSKPNTLQLSALKGNVLLVMTLLGKNADGSTMLNGAVGLANLALPSI